MIDLQGLFFVILIFALYLFLMVPIILCKVAHERRSKNE